MKFASKRRLYALSAVLLLLASFVLPGCTGWQEQAETTSSAEVSAAPALTAGVNLLGSYSRKATEDPVVTDVLRSACNSFSFTLFKQVASENREGNILISPLSAYYCLALAANGADGETKTEMEKILGLSVEDMNRELYAFSSKLPSSADQKMSLANSLWFRDTDDLSMKETYLQSLADWYDAAVFSDPFDEMTASRINSWCSEKTDGMIDKILDNPPSANDMLFLLNAVAFRGKWDRIYDDSQIIEKAFRNADGSTETVSMLRANESIYLENDSAIGFVKPYRNHEFLFAALLPSDENTDIYEFAAALGPDIWNNLWENRTYGATVKTMIPEFKAEEDYLLTDTLKEIGIRQLFSENADLSKMAQSDSRLAAGIVRQKTWLNLNREGTEAAAVTVIGATKAAAPSQPEIYKEVFLDRPFVYLILKDEIPVFIGVEAAINP